MQLNPVGYLFHMWYCKFPCYSLLTSHPLPPPPTPAPCQVCFLCLFLHCGPENKFICTIFLDSIYMCQYTIFILLFLSSLCVIGSRFVHLIRNDSNVFLLWLSSIPLCICTTASLSIHLSMDIYVASMF